jgi:PAS domain S-box-containing protein
MTTHIPEIDGRTADTITIINPHEQTREVLKGLLDKIFIIALILGGLATATSVARVARYGWHPNIIIDVSVYSLAISLLIIRRHVKIEIVASALLILVGLAGIGNMLTLSLASVALLMLASVCVVSGVFFGLRTAIAALIVCLIFSSATGWAICTGAITLTIDTNKYLRSPDSWLAQLMGFTLYVTAIIVSIASIQKRLYTSMNKLNRQSEQLFEREQKYRMLAENMNDVLFIQDMDLNITYISPSVEKMFGYTAEEALKMKPADYFTPESLERVLHSFRQVVNNLEHEHVEIPMMENEYIRRDGSTFRGEIRVGFLFDSNGKPVGSQGLLRDISERKAALMERENLEQRLRHSEKMEAIGQLAGGIAHDFNNHLTGIMGWADSIRIASAQNSEISESARNIISVSRRAADLVSKLMVFARQGTYQRVRVNLHSILSEVAAILTSSIDKRIIVTSLFEAKQPVITGDSTQLESAFLNLGINARDALPDGGEISFSTRDISLTKTDCDGSLFHIKPGPHIEITVTDNGTGIRPENLKRIFDPFFTTKDVGKGTGMGLAAVYGTVANHSGSIDVSSKVGKGSTFRILLPV